MYRFWHSVTRPLLDTLQPMSVVEIGVSEGQQTELLLPYAQQRGIIVHCIDTKEPPHLPAWRQLYADTLVFHHGPSRTMLPLVPSYDVVLIDGDHNWYTVYGELLEIERRATEKGHFPVVLLHDIGWPYGRRDLYYNPQEIPETFRQHNMRGGVRRGQNHLADDGLNAWMHHASTEGGAQNGVLTAVEDFLAETSHDLHFLHIETMHGLGVIVPKDLLAQNPQLRDLLRDLDPSQPLVSLLHTAEDLRLHALMHREQHVVQRQHGAPEETLQAEIDRMKRSLSWKITAPLRKAGHIMRNAHKIPAFLEKKLSGTPLVRGIRTNAPAAKKIPEQVDVIVLHHGDMHALLRTLESIAAQSALPQRTVIADTTDGPALHAGNMLKNADLEITVIRTEGGVALMEHIGIRSHAAEYVVCAEAGTVFSHNYLEAGLHALRHTTTAAIALTDYAVMDTGITVTVPSTLEQFDISSAQFFHLSCMARRDALVHAWTLTGEDDPQRLWQEMLAQGWKAVKSNAFAALPFAPASGAGMRFLSNPLPRATLCLSLSGRAWAWPLMRRFLEEQTYRHDAIHIILMDTSQDEDFGMMLRSWLHTCDYAGYTYLCEVVGPKGVADLPREDVARQINDACTAMYNRFGRLCTTPIAFIVEDDVIPPHDAFVRMQQLRREGVVSVSGVYRHRQEPRLVAWEWSKEGNPVPCPSMKLGVTAVGGNGFGCVMINGPYFRRSMMRGGPPIRNVDHNFYHQAVYKEGRTALMDWSIVCRHYVHADHWVVPH